MPFVVDNSVVAGWFFPSQATDYSDRILESLKTDIAHVPALWTLEFSNVLRKAILARKFSRSEAAGIVWEVGQLPLSINHAADSLTENLDMAIEHGLSSYDTAYLSLALRLDLPIATQDKALRSAAIRVGIGIVEPTTIPSTRPSSN